MRKPLFNHYCNCSTLVDQDMFRGLSCWVFTVFVLAVTGNVIANHYHHFERYGSLMNDPCISKQTCHECIQAAPQCVWCSAPRFQSPRCFTPSETDRSAVCPEEWIWNPSKSYSLLRNAQLTKANFSAAAALNYNHSSSSDDSYSRILHNGRRDVVQIAPQEVSLKLRKNDVQNISFTFTQATDFPIDIYYLTNFKHPRENSNNTLLGFGELLVESVRNLTSNFRLGFGSVISNYPTQAGKKSYGFRNFVELTQDTNAFAHAVRDFENSSNFEAANGGLDAVLQAIVCHDMIGWRSNSYKLLILATDAELPQAINGTFNEKTSENYGICRLNETGFSTYPSTEDYPTVPLLNYRAKQNKVNIIWATSRQHYNQFRNLGRYVEGSDVSKLTNSSSPILKLIKKHYNKISSSIEIRHTASRDVSIKYFSNCLSHDTPRQMSKCEGLKVGTIIEFRAEIEVMKCPIYQADWHETIYIYPVGVIDTLRVHLDFICDCDCERPTNPTYERHSPQCFGAGTLKCGICECDDSYYGKRCECSTTEAYSMSANLCIPNNETLIACSGRGMCTCGKCECEQRANVEEVISGDFCECDNFSCDYHEGKMCSNHGTCTCGQCLCNPGWTGRVCENPV